MPTSQIFTWKEGAGWLVLSGGQEETSAVRATAIERIAADGAVAVVSFGSPSDDKVLDDLQDLGAPAGYLVDVLAEDDDTIRKQLGDAAMVVVSWAGDPAGLRSNLLGAGIEGLETAYGQGAVILAEGRGAAVFGTHLNGGVGFGWLENGYVVPGLESAAESAEVRRMVAEQPQVIVVGPLVGSAIAFGGNGTLETWGERQVTIALGNAYTSG
jgi:hypothetical protein